MVTIFFLCKYGNTKTIRKSLQETRRYHDDPLGNIVNLSKKTFTYYVFKLLNKNLNFIPNPGNYNSHDLQTDTNNFIRTVIFRAHFGNDTNKKLDPYHSLKEANIQWVPKETHHTVDTFIEKIQKDLSELKPNNRDNLTRPERKALNSHKKRDDIIITIADKGGAIVIIDVNDYLKEAHRQLKDEDFYAELTHIPTSKYGDIINKAIESFIKEKLISEQLGKNLMNANPKTPHVYFRPKIPKGNNPGRPIVSSINSHSAKISHFVDIHLQPIVDGIKSRIKDTTDFINKIEKIFNLPEEAIIVIMDVKSLFTNIPHAEGINAVAKALEKLKDVTISNLVILKLLSVTL